MSINRGIRNRPLFLDYEKMVITNKRACVRCKQEKVLNMFYSFSRRSENITTDSACKECRRNQSKLWRKNNPEKAKDLDLRKSYGITLEEKKALLESQGGVCAGCGTDTPGGKYNEWNLDHCHDSKVIRGILCANCNFILGLVKNNSEHLYKLAAYMSKFQHLVVN